jgi:hypothetical protein
VSVEVRFSLQIPPSTDSKCIWQHAVGIYKPKILNEKSCKALEFTESGEEDDRCRDEGRGRMSFGF